MCAQMTRRTPKFGEWDASNPTFTMVFENMRRADKSMNHQGIIDLNDPAALANYLQNLKAEQTQQQRQQHDDDDDDDDEEEEEEMERMSPLPKPPAWRTSNVIQSLTVLTQHHVSSSDTYTAFGLVYNII